MALHPPQGLVPPRQALQSIEVTLMPGDGPIPARPMPVREAVRPALAGAPPRAPARQEGQVVPLPLAAATQRPALADTPPRAPARQEGQVVPLPLAAATQRPALADAPPRAPAQSAGLSSLPEREFAVVQHKRLVRQHLKSQLSYPAGWNPGTVHLHLVLGPDGALQESSVSQASDPLLGLTALNGARSAAPYPPFPKEMKESRADYEFLVQYRQRADAE
ncbi:MAG: energy transducer TonB [Candidatus Omnitrophica bacterium]|nr:energy transducer TonB [Candidatus Omnitrophota bacterium]